MSSPRVTRRDIPDATVNRLPVYLRSLNSLATTGVRTISSESLAELTGVSSAKLRKDLSALGSYGVRGVGYDIGTLIERIRATLGLVATWSVAIIGMGNLGRALATYGGMGVRGFEIRWLIDDNPSVVGTSVGDRAVVGFDALQPRPGEGVIGIIATPEYAAQRVADRLVAVGVRSILNFAPGVLNVPHGVQVRTLDVATELQILAFRGTNARMGDNSNELKELTA